MSNKKEVLDFMFGLGNFFFFPYISNRRQVRFRVGDGWIATPPPLEISVLFYIVRAGADVLFVLLPFIFVAISHPWGGEEEGIVCALLPPQSLP